MNFSPMKTLFCTLLLVLGLTLQQGVAQPASVFPYTEPAYVAGDDAREWISLHFWDNYDFARAKELYTSQASREGFALFVHTLYVNPFEVAMQSLEGMLHKAAATEDGYWNILEIAEDVLYDPLSPIRNDMLWEQVLLHAISPASPLDDGSKARYRTLHRIVSRNQEGALSTDFVYTTANGKKARMHDLESPLVLLYFYNPGCGECAYAREKILSTGYLEELYRRGLIKVLAVYPDGDIEEWRKYLTENPSWWITSYDDGGVISKEDLYDLKAVPTFYLLDSEKVVIMKDPSVEALIEQLSYMCEM